MIQFTQTPLLTITQLEKLQQELRNQFSKPIDIPVTVHALDLEVRKSSTLRQFKHIHQTSVIAVWDFKILIKMRLLLLIDGYMALQRAKSGLPLYSLARSVMEMHGLVKKVNQRLNDYEEGSRSDWKSRGEGFFRYITRARCGTRDSELSNELIKSGVPKKALEPIHSSECESALFSDPEYADSKSLYAKLCDYVHTNSQGYYVGSSGWYKSISFMMPDGSPGMTREPGPINRYEYPADTKFNDSVSITYPIMNVHSAGIIKDLAKIPVSPYCKEEIEKHTGTSHGIQYIPPVYTSKSVFELEGKIGRNDPCPCGSGKKYKHCHC